MKKTGRRGCRTCLIVLGILVVLVLAAGVVAYLSLDTIVSRIIQSQLPEGMLDDLSSLPPPPTQVPRDAPLIQVAKRPGTSSDDDQGLWAGGRPLPEDLIPGSGSSPRAPGATEEPDTTPPDSGGDEPTPNADSSNEAPSPTRDPASATLSGLVAFTRNHNNTNGGQEIMTVQVASSEITQLTRNQAADWIPSWSPDGRTLIFTSNRSGNYDTWRMGRKGGNVQPVITLPAWDEYPAWSPNGARIAFASTGETDGVANSEVFVREASGEIKRITFNKGRDEWPTWSANSKRVANSSDRDGDMDIYITAISNGQVTQWTNWPGFEEQPAWSPDGQWIAFIAKTEESNGNGNLDRLDDGDLGTLWIGRRDGSDFRQLTFEHRFADPAWSPDSGLIVVARFADSNGDGHLSQYDNSSLWIYSIEGGDPVKLTGGDAQDRYPDWTR